MVYDYSITLRSRRPTSDLGAFAAYTGCDHGVERQSSCPIDKTLPPRGPDLRRRT